jgi:hypothetical protein
VATCECIECHTSGANSRNRVTGTMYCRKCAIRVNSLYPGMIEINVINDDKKGLLDFVVSDCLEQGTSLQEM